MSIYFGDKHERFLVKNIDVTSFNDNLTISICPPSLTGGLTPKYITGTENDLVELCRKILSKIHYSQLEVSVAMATIKSNVQEGEGGKDVKK
jgi:hypothetical protein